MQPAMPAADEPAGEPAMAVVVDDVVVGHRRERDADVEAGRLVEDRRWRRPGVECGLRCLLDDRAVHHRVGERDADLDGVGPAAAAARTASTQPG